MKFLIFILSIFLTIVPGYLQVTKSQSVEREIPPFKDDLLRQKLLEVTHKSIPSLRDTEQHFLYQSSPDWIYYSNTNQILWPALALERDSTLWVATVGSAVKWNLSNHY